MTIVFGSYARETPQRQSVESMNKANEHPAGDEMRDEYDFRGGVRVESRKSSSRAARGTWGAHSNYQRVACECPEDGFSLPGVPGLALRGATNRRKGG